MKTSSSAADAGRTNGELRAAQGRGSTVIAALIVGYVGIYLCRKNLAVAMPLLQRDFGAAKEQVGIIASVGTFGYAAGKLLNGSVVDRIGGRRGFLTALALVSLFGATSAFAPTLLVLASLYGVNRFVGAGAWGAMVKLVPSWFGVTRSATVFGILSLSYVGGGVAAVMLARYIVAAGGGWRLVMGLPAVLLAAVAVGCAFIVRSGPYRETISSQPMSRLDEVRQLLRSGPFLRACGLSFAVTLMREAFNNWSVDFLTDVQGARGSVATAALHSIGFDLAGAVAILASGFAYDRQGPRGRRALMAGNLILLAGVLALLPTAAAGSLALGALLLGAVGFLVYGPYSLLSGVIAIETGGMNSAATAAGIIDGVGYVAAILAGAGLGTLLDWGGYALGFRVLAGVGAIAAVIALAGKQS